MKGKKVLDFGCGDGTQTLLFAHHANTILGFDVKREEIEKFFKTIFRNDIKNVCPMSYDGQNLPSPDGSVDVVISFEVLEHTQDDSKALNEIYRVLKVGGELVMSVPNKAWVFETHGARLPLLPWNRVPFFSWLPKSIHEQFSHARIYRRKEIASLLRKHGFEVLGSEYTTAPMDIIKVGWLQNLLRSTLFRGDTTKIPLLSTSIITYCKKI